MAFRKRAPMGLRGFVLLGSISGGTTFLVLWADGSEIGGAVLAGLAVAAWLVGFIAALNWYNQFRQRQVADIVRQLPTDSAHDQPWNDPGAIGTWLAPDDPEADRRN